MHRALILLIIALSPAVAAEKWIRLASENFELYTPSKEGEARRTLELFEQVRDFFMRVKSSQLTTQLPVTIVGFRNPKEFAPYSIKDGTDAYYIADEQRDFIVMSDLGQEHAPVAIHEYMHLLVRHSGLQLPVWLNEGLAEVYSTLKPVGGQILIGSVPQGRGYVLDRKEWFPIARLAAIGKDSAEFNERDRRSIFYAQSWLLTHMLMLGDGYRENFTRFTEELSASGSTERAFGAVYGRQLADVAKDLRLYYRSNRLNGVLLKTRFEKMDVGAARPATELETGITLAKLLTFAGRDREAAERLEALSRKYDASAELPEALAYLHWRRRDTANARKYFELAVERGVSGWKTWWDYARLLAGQDGADDRQLEVLTKAVELKPDFMDARLALGHELYRKQRYAQALMTLREARNVNPERAPMVLLTMAYSALRLNQRDEAVRYAEQVRRYARKPEDLEAADKLLQYVRQQKSGASDSRSHSESALHSKQELRSIHGRLTQLECLGTTARLQVQVGALTHAFLIRDAADLKIRRGGSGFEMNCGPQDLPVTLEYLPSPDAATKTEGVIRMIEFGVPPRP